MFWCLDTMGTQHDYDSPAARAAVLMQGARLSLGGYFNRLLQRFARAGDHLVECGGGPGWLGHNALQLGMTYEGYEISTSYSRVARDFFNVRVHTTGFLEAGGKADVVVMLQVLEHVPWPLQFLRKAYELLKPGGRIIVGTPNMGLGYVLLRLTAALGRPLPRADVFRPPEHLSLFHPRTFGAIERLVGFRRLRLLNNRHSAALEPSSPAGRVRRVAHATLRSLALVGLTLDSNLLYIAERPPDNVP
jgi:SAM-dependent methyltransferase